MSRYLHSETPDSSLRLWRVDWAQAGATFGVGQRTGIVEPPHGPRCRAVVVGHCPAFRWSLEMVSATDARVRVARVHAWAVSNQGAAIRHEIAYVGAG